MIYRRTLPIFLRETVGASLSSQNGHVALEYLRNLSDKGDLALQETCVLAWGEIARYNDYEAPSCT